MELGLLFPTLWVSQRGLQSIINAQIISWIWHIRAYTNTSLITILRTPRSYFLLWGPLRSFGSLWRLLQNSSWDTRMLHYLHRQLQHSQHLQFPTSTPSLQPLPEVCNRHPQRQQRWPVSLTCSRCGQCCCWRCFESQFPTSNWLHSSPQDFSLRTVVVVPWHWRFTLLPTPSRYTGGGQAMIQGTRGSRQPIREFWSREQLVHGRAITLGNAINWSTLSNYSSAINSYLNFVKLHDLPVEHTPETLSFFTVYMCHHINPRSVNSYLSSISQQLETNFPSVKEARNSTLVHCTLQGCMRMKDTTTVRWCNYGQSTLRKHTQTTKQVCDCVTDS